MRRPFRMKTDFLVPTLFLVVLFVYFGIASNGRFLSIVNLGGIIDQSISIIIGGLGTIFVIAIGSVELSNSGSLAISALVGGILAQQFGSEPLAVVVIIVLSAFIGLLNGLIVTKLHVTSFLTTISMMMILQGLFTYSQTIVGMYSAGSFISSFYEPYIEIPILVILIALSFYLMEYTKFGKYCQAIGENENAALNMGIPVDRVKILAFVASGAAAGIAGIFMMAKLGGVTNSMGNNFHMDVMMALFLGGVLVTGGTSARTFKLILGAITLVVLKNGLIMIGLTQTAWSQSVRGIALMLLLFVTMKFGGRVVHIRRLKSTPSGN